MGLLAEFEADMAGFDPAAADPACVRTLVDRLHASRRRLVAFEDQLTEAAERHAATGAAPPAEDTLSGGGQIPKGEARRAQRRRKAAKQLESLEKSLREGSARSANVDAIARALGELTDPRHREAFTAFDQRLTKLAETLPPRQFSRRLQSFVRLAMADDGLTLFQRQRAQSRLSIWRNNNGMYHVKGELDPEWGLAVSTALDQEMKTLAGSSDRNDSGATPLDDHLRAEAFTSLLTRSARPGERALVLPHVSLIINHDRSISEFADGTRVCTATAERLCCDAVVNDIVLDQNGLPLAVGRRYRTATTAQRLALRAMYRTCAFPDCDQPFHFCQIHHLTPWEHGGDTDLGNLLPLCNRHHHLAHEGGWTLKLEPDRTLWTWRPDGHHHATTPPPRLTECDLDGVPERSIPPPSAVPAPQRSEPPPALLDRPAVTPWRVPHPSVRRPNSRTR